MGSAPYFSRAVLPRVFVGVRCCGFRIYFIDLPISDQSLSRMLGSRSGLSIPVVVLGDNSVCSLLVQMEVACIPDSEGTPLLLPEQVNNYGPMAEVGELIFQDLNQL